MRIYLDIDDNQIIRDVSLRLSAAALQLQPAVWLLN